MTMGREGQPEGNLPIETLFPKDVLPTAHFLSKLPGFDVPYGKVIPAKEISAWSGKAVIGEAETIIQIGHTYHETSILLDRQVGKESWEILERYTDVIKIALRSARVPLTVLLPNQAFKVGKPDYEEYLMDVHLYFKEGVVTKYRDYPKKPSDHFLVTESMIDLEKTAWGIKQWGGGFDSVEQALGLLRNLKTAILSATPIEPLEDRPPNPRSNSLIDNSILSDD